RHHHRVQPLRRRDRQRRQPRNARRTLRSAENRAGDAEVRANASSAFASLRAATPRRDGASRRPKRRERPFGGRTQLKTAPKTGLISLLLAKIRLYTAPSHTEAWLYKAVRWQPGHMARLLTRFRRNQPEN